MRVRKICTHCGKLKLMCDFLVNKESHDKRTQECKDCINELQFGEFNSKINNNQTIEKMATLKEKREAAKAANSTNQEATAPVVKESKEKVTPKVGETTEEGHKVVGEKKEPGKRGRKAAPEKPIEQLNPETGEVIGRYETLQEAADAVGAKTASVLDALRGWVKKVKGSQWRYEGEEVFVRTPKTPVAKEFLNSTPKTTKKDKTVVEDIPVPGDLDYDEELHGQKTVVEEEDLMDGFDAEEQEQ